MEEEIKEVERSANEAEKHRNDVVLDVNDDPWVKQMEEKLASKSEQCPPSHRFTICKVPLDIRGVDSVAHDPLVVSIGPYHRGNKNLLDMEQVKWRNLDAFRRRAGKDCYLKAMKEMKEIEPRARDCYSGKIDMKADDFIESNIDMKADDFIEMMLLDGLFMIALFLITGKNLPPLLPQPFNIDKEPIYTISGMLDRVSHDMLLLENQLPSFVLERLWNVLTDRSSRFYLWESACTFILDSVLTFEHNCDLRILPVIFDKEENKKENSEMINEEYGVHHLLHLVYLLLKPAEPTDLSILSRLMEKPLSDLSFISPFIKNSLSYQSFISRFIEKILYYLSFIWGFIMKILSYLCRFILKILSYLSLVCRFIMKIHSYRSFLSRFIKKTLSYLSFLCPSLPKDGQKVIPSAVELDEAGVVFEYVEAESFFDVKFEGGTMKMPRLSVQDSTKSLFRNFIAYEQCFPHQGSHFTSYCSLMDHLVNTRRDVEILKKSNIIENWLGSDKEVAVLFNDLGKGIFVSNVKGSYLGKLSNQVTKHTQKTWPKWQAKLNRDYFSSPWAIISLIAAIYVLFLTSVQTYKAVFT